MTGEDDGERILRRRIADLACAAVRQAQTHGKSAEGLHRAEGDLTQPELNESADDMGRIARAFNQMTRSLKELLSRNQEF